MRFPLKEMQGWTLDQKVHHALEVIDVFYQRMQGKVYIAFSGGKDSVVLAFLVDFYTDLIGAEKVPMVFNNTTNEYKEILEFVRTYGDRVIWLRPKMTFAESLKVNGYPLVGKEQAHYIFQVQNTKSEKLRQLRLYGREYKSKKTGKSYIAGKISEKWKFLINSGIKITSKCCDILKKRPVKQFEKASGLSPFTGEQASESSLRTQRYLRTGCNEFSDKRNISRPLSIFNDEDVWELIRKYSIEYCSIYDDQTINGVFVPGEKRTGCAYCAFGVQYEDKDNTRFHRLQIREPNRFKSFMLKLDYQKALSFLGLNFNFDAYKNGEK
ncbi:MAG: phosphoadenosine phosphosulfate reductase family protein [bacterium]|nr:phosphoadenosine phosphosulfate reductase family protein [bacterium]